MDFENPESHNFYRCLHFQGRGSPLNFLHVLQKPQLVYIYSLPSSTPIDLVAAVLS